MGLDASGRLLHRRETQVIESLSDNRCPALHAFAGIVLQLQSSLTLLGPLRFTYTGDGDGRCDNDWSSNYLRMNLLHRQHSLVTTTATRLSAVQLDTLQVILGRGCTFEITATRLSAIQIDALLTILVILDGWSEAIGTNLSEC